ncbi:Crp/Fnr family transcriptional regulator [Caenimonas terrae]|uniref:Crp/Fnr family transcriptional regulator n=1 Tax=Caenimonas terrae TaxID=696074 RepID=A0ABW0NKP1_9BURK
MPATRNLVLDSLPRKVASELLEQLTPVELAFGEVLYEPGQPIRAVYFPLEGLVSLLTVVGDRLAVEVGMVGREGIVGIALALGVPHSPMRALVQRGGAGLRMDRARFDAAMARHPPLRKALLAYANSLMAQIARTAACNRFHVVEERLARWLVMARDRAEADDFSITQEFLSSILGVRRVGVSAAASAFQHRKLIEYSRGRIRILDHAGLEAACCTCYRDEPASLPPWRPAGAPAPTSYEPNTSRAGRVSGST